MDSVEGASVHGSLITNDKGTRNRDAHNIVHVAVISGVKCVNLFPNIAAPAYMTALDNTASCANTCCPNPCSASAPTINATPTTPMHVPNSFNQLVVSWRVNKNVIRKTNTGDVEFNTLASALSTNCCPHANTVQAPMLVRNDCTKSKRQVFPSRGKRYPFQITIALKKIAAINTRIAISVIGGIVSTATLISKYDEPHSNAKRHSSALSKTILC